MVNAPAPPCILPRCPNAQPGEAVAYFCKVCGCAAYYDLRVLADGLPHTFHSAVEPLLDAMRAEGLVVCGKDPLTCWITAAGRKKVGRTAA